MQTFEEKLKEVNQFPITARSIEIMQINVGRRCNLSCKHCHVEAGPQRDETMPLEIFGRCLEVLGRYPQIKTVDITGGAPEMNINVSQFICELSEMQKRILVRTNLAILLEEKYKKFIDVYLDNNVEIYGSLPCYTENNVDEQRGRGTFDKSIKVLKLLNSKGYGLTGSGLMLNLTYNPLGPFLPALQRDLELDYKTNMEEKYGIVFNKLFCITNMPIGRFLFDLQKNNIHEAYTRELAKLFNLETLPNLMCKNTISVGYDGKLFDCDFNQMMGISISDKSADHIDRFEYDILCKRKIITQEYCYGCAAGAGSSCQGAIF